MRGPWMSRRWYTVARRHRSRPMNRIPPPRSRPPRLGAALLVLALQPALGSVPTGGSSPAPAPSPSPATPVPAPAPAPKHVPSRVDGGRIHFTGVTPRSAVVRWEEPSLGRWKWPIQGYRIRVSLQERFPKITSATYSADHPGAGAVPGDWIELAGVSSSDETDYQGRTWYRISTLVPDVWYRFQVRAYNLNGLGNWSTSSYALHTPAVPEPPAMPVVVGRTHSVVLLRWSAPLTRGTVDCPDIALKDVRKGVCTTAGKGANVTGFHIYVTRKPGVKNSDKKKAGNASVPLAAEPPLTFEPLVFPMTGLQVGLIRSTYYAVRGCKSSTTYGFRISAANAAGEGQPGEPVFVSTNTVPAAPDSPEIYAKTHSSIALMWEPPDSDPQTPVLGYRLFGGRWDWEFSRWVPASPSVLSIHQRKHVSYDDLVVEPGESPHPWPAGMDPSEWGEFQLPDLAQLSGIPSSQSGSGQYANANRSSDGWNWAGGDVAGQIGLSEWAGRRLDGYSDLPRFEGAGWSSYASDAVHEDLHRRRMQASSATNATLGANGTSITNANGTTPTGYAHDMYIRDGTYYAARPIALVPGTLYFNVNYLMNNQYYRFQVLAINAAGQGPVSPPSQVERLLDSPVTSVQIFSGPPCLYRQQAPTKFMAVSDGSGVYYRWTTSTGNTAGSCKSVDCSVMEYQYVDVGTNMLLVTAINNVGSIMQSMTVNVSYCGCTDRADPNFWWLATYHIPKLCSQIETWPNVSKSVAMGEAKYFDLPIPDDAYKTELVVRVERGAVGVYISSTRLPDILSNITYDQRFVGPEILDPVSGNSTDTYTGIRTFQLMNTYFKDMSEVVAGQLTGSKWMYIAVVGFDSFTQFDLVGKVTQYTRSTNCRGTDVCVESATRRNLQNPVVNMTVGTPYYDFYEYYFEAAQLMQRIDVEVKLTVVEGCVQLYASQTERYPSPKRAGATEYGYMTDKSTGGCVGGTAAGTAAAAAASAGGTAPKIVASPEMSVVFNIESHQPRVLYLSVQGTDMQELKPGKKPPVSKYHLSITAFDYSRTTTVVNQATMKSGQQIQDVVIEDNFKFFEIRVSDSTTTINVTVTTVYGVADLYISAKNKPTQSVYDVRVRDTDGDKVLRHQLKFADIEMDGFFYIGVFGRSPSCSFFVNVAEVRLEEDKVITKVSKEYIAAEDSVNATSGGPACTQTGRQCHQLNGYRYFKAERPALVANATNGSAVTSAAGGVDADDLSVFSWTGPYTAEYVEANFNSRTEDLVVELQVNGITFAGTWYAASYLRDSQYTVSSPLYSLAQTAVNVTIYGSSLDPFPGHLRTYDVLTRIDLRSKWDALLLVPLFQWSGGPVYFSVYSPLVEIHYDFVVRVIDFDRSIMLSEDKVLPSGLCPGQMKPSDLPCSGHGSCLGYNGADSPLQATCFCNNGWLGTSCAVERFPQWPLVQVLSPNSSTPVSSTIDSGVVVQYVSPLHPNNTDSYIEGQREYWDEVDLVLYVDGRPYPQPYPNNVFPAPKVNDTVPTQFAIHNLRDGSPHNIQLYVMYIPEYAVLQTISLDFYLATVGTGCTSTGDCSSQGLCYHGYCVCFDGWVGVDCSLSQHGDKTVSLNRTSQGFRDRLVASLQRKALGVGYETSVMVDSAADFMNRQDSSLLLRLQEAVDHVNAGRIWNKETVEYFLTKYGNEAEEKARERTAALAELSAEFDALDHALEGLDAMLGKSHDHVINIRKRVEARLDQLKLDYQWERRVKYSEWRMVKERALFNMDEVRHANGPRVPIDRLQKQVCASDNRFRTECKNERLATPTVTPVLEDTSLMYNYDISGTTYAEYQMHAEWEEMVRIQVCNATCHGVLDPCESPTLVRLFNLTCTRATEGLYVDLGQGYCRDNEGVKPNGYYKRLASASLCAQYCELGATCLGYTWSSDGLCYLYYSDFVARAGQDYSELYEHWHVIPTGWYQFVPQGSAGSRYLGGTDGNPSRRCFARAIAIVTNVTSNSTTTTNSSAAPEPEPEPEPEPNWLNSGVTFGTLLPSASGTPTMIGGEGNASNATTCWTGQKLIDVVEQNVAIGGHIYAFPEGDVPGGALVDKNLDRNWHSKDGRLDTAQMIRITLPKPGLQCISGVKLYWRNVYTAKSYAVSSSTDGLNYTHDLLQGAGMNVEAKKGRIDEYSFAMHDAKMVQFDLLEKQHATTLDYDLLEIEVYGIPGKCNDTFAHEPAVNMSSQLAIINQMRQQQQAPAGASTAGTIGVAAAYAFRQQCTPMPGQEMIDKNGDWNCGSISRNQLLVDCKTLVRQPSHPAPPMDPGPKNLLEYLGLDWEMRSRMLSQKCAAWDVIRESEPEVCYGEVQAGWKDSSRVPSATVLHASICDTSGRAQPTCRLFSHAHSYHENSRTISGSLRQIEAQKTVWKYDEFDEQPGYTMSVMDGIFGEELKEEVAHQLYHDVPR